MARPLQTVDPGTGDPRAPLGSEPWAQHIRLKVECLVTHAHDRPTELGSYLDLLMQHEAWKVLNRPDGSFFTTLEEFCSHRRPWGLGMSPAEVARRVSLATTGQAFKALAPPPEGPAIEQVIPIEQARALPIHPAANLLPMLGEAELAQLAADIAEHGQRHPIVIFEGQVLDGRNRLLACERAGVEPRVEIKSACDSPIVFVLSVNVQRRHLTTSQRVKIARLAVEGIEGERAKARQAAAAERTNAIRRGETVSLNRGEASDDGKAAQQAAKLMGSSRASVERAIAVHAHGVPELVEAFERDEVSVSAAATVATLPPEEQREVMAQGKAKEAAREVREKKKAKPAPPPSAPQAPTDEPPDACPKCGGRAFRDASEKAHDGSIVKRWVCKAPDCGRVEKPKRPGVQTPAEPTDDALRAEGQALLAGSSGAELRRWVEIMRADAATRTA
jgi:ParB-like chromosome segregation protein Spo0J